MTQLGRGTNGACGARRLLQRRTGSFKRALLFFFNYWSGRRRKFNFAVLQPLKPVLTTDYKRKLSSGNRRKKVYQNVLFVTRFFFLLLALPSRSNNADTGP